MFFLLCFSFSVLKAQINKANTKDAINARRVEVITKALNLTSNDAEKFWPIFNEFEQKKEEIRRERTKAKKKLAADKDNKLSEKEIEILIDTEILFHQKEYTIAQERHQRLKLFFSMKKISLLYRAEEDFKKFLLKEACEGLNNSKKGNVED
jgi:arsenate reductase-like glutaredoxin family protein